MKQISKILQILLLVQISLQQFHDNIDLEQIYNQHLFDLQGTLEPNLKSSSEDLFSYNSENNAYQTQPQTLLKDSFSQSKNTFSDIATGLNTFQTQPQNTFQDLNSDNLFTELPKELLNLEGLEEMPDLNYQQTPIYSQVFEFDQPQEIISQPLSDNFNADIQTEIKNLILAIEKNILDQPINTTRKVSTTPVTTHLTKPISKNSTGSYTSPTSKLTTLVRSSLINNTVEKTTIKPTTTTAIKDRSQTLLKSFHSQVSVQRIDDKAKNLTHHTRGVENPSNDDFYDRSANIFNRQKKSHELKKRVHNEIVPVGARPPKESDLLNEKLLTNHVHLHQYHHVSSSNSPESVSVFSLILMMATLILVVGVVISVLLCRRY